MKRGQSAYLKDSKAECANTRNLALFGKSPSAGLAKMLIFMCAIGGLYGPGDSDARNRRRCPIGLARRGAGVGRGPWATGPGSLWVAAHPPAVQPFQRQPHHPSKLHHAGF